MFNTAANIYYGDPQGAYERGQEAFAKRQELEQANALRQVMAQYGGLAMEGDQNALRMLAQHDPEYALGLRETQQQMGFRANDDQRASQAHGLGMQLDQERLEQMRVTGQREAAKYAAGISAEERAREMDEINRFGSALGMAYQAGPEEWAKRAPEILKGAPPELQGLTYETAPYGMALLGGSVEGFRAPEAASPVQLGANERLVDPTTGREIVGAAPAPAEGMTAATRSLQERAIAGGLVPGTPEFQDYMRNGGVERTQQVPTEGERKAADFLGRMEAAEQTLQGLSDAGHDRIGVGEHLLGSVPFMPESVALGAGSEQVLQAQRDWVRSKLRLESGAVIGDEEMREEIKTYFPQTGDSPEVVKQKAKARQQAMEQVRTMGGRASTPETAAPAGIPKSALDAGIDPDLWQYLSPEDQALWN